MKKTLSVMLSLIMLVSSSITVFAEEEQAIQEENGVNVQVVDAFEEEMHEVDASELTKSDCLPVKAPEKEIRLEEGTKLEKTGNASKLRSSGSTQSVYGTIANEGEYAYDIIALNPNEAINVTLECPRNSALDYDLFLYEVDSEGYLGNMLTGSSTETYMNTYPDGTIKTLDEAFAYTNKTTEVKYYAIIVLASVGGSTTDTFKLTFSVIDGSECDVAEPNDSPYDAYELPEIAGGTTTFSQLSLHIVNDQDWFLWRAPSDAAGVEISATLKDVTSNQYYNVEVYKAEGNKMILSSRNGSGNYRIGPGVNYIRVFADEASFTESSYELALKPWSNTAAKINVRLDGDEGDKQYAPYPGGTYFRFQYKLCPEIQIVSASGYLVRDQLVKLTWKSGSWAEHTGNMIREISGHTNNEGRVVLTLARDLPSPNDLPISLGQQSCFRDGPIQFIDYYDVDGIAITAGNAPAYITAVYHLMRSDYFGS